MFQLSQKEFDSLKSQIATSSWGGRRKLPYAFSEQVVAMLSGVLHSERAIKVYIHIMRVFSRMCEILTSHKELLRKEESYTDVLPENGANPFNIKLVQI